MPSSYEAAFVDQLSAMNDESLLRTLVRVEAAPTDYRPEALAAVKAEVARRGLNAAQQHDAAKLAKEEALEAVHEYAASLVLEGRSRTEIEAVLNSRGVDSATADRISTSVSNLPAEELKRAGRKKMLHGALWCIGGAAATTVSYYEAAASPGGGRYMVAWGAVCFGIVQFLRGLAQWLRKR